jgi:hypothetical protein
LGKMPFGANYLEKNVTQIIADPIFTDVRDRSNANFLWFIKFERSFTEAERDVSANTGSQSQTKTTKIDSALGGPSAGTNATKSTATILAFPRPLQEKTDKKLKKKAAGGQQADIVLFIPPFA